MQLLAESSNHLRQPWAFSRSDSDRMENVIPWAGHEKAMPWAFPSIFLLGKNSRQQEKDKTKYETDWFHKENNSLELKGVEQEDYWGQDILENTHLWGRHKS